MKDPLIEKAGQVWHNECTEDLIGYLPDGWDE